MKKEEPKQIVYNGDKDVEERFREHWNKFIKYQTSRDQPLVFFQNRSLLEYVSDSVERMNEYHEKPSYKEPWQNNVFDPITRNKLVTILSKIAATRMKPDLLVKGKSIFDVKNARKRKVIYSDLLEAANRKNDDDRQLIWEMFQAMSEGTVIGYEDWRKDTRTVEYVKEYNPENGDKKTETITYDAWDDVFGEIVPIAEFFPETIWVGTIDEVKRCFRVKEMTFEHFQDTFSKFKNASSVQPKSFYYDTERGDIQWGIGEDIEGENVQVLQYYDEVKGKLGMWANGVELYYGAMPWNHNKIPFWLSQFEPIHPQFLYGKSLPDKMKGMQDINNGVFNGMLDQLLMSLNSPIFIDGNLDDLDDDYMEPGKIYSIDAGSKVQRGALGNVDPTAFQMLQLVKRSMDESSVSSQAQGIATGGRKTRYEVELLNEGAMNLASLFLQMIEMSIRRKYYLRMYNVLQYYSQPSNVASGKSKFKFLVLKDRELSNKQIGTKMIQITGSMKDAPNSNKLRELASEAEGKPFDVMKSIVQPVVISKDYLMNKDFDLEISIVPNSSVKESENQKKRSDVAFFQMANQDPYFDQLQSIKDLATGFDKDPDIVQEPKQQPGQPGMTPPGGAGEGQGQQQKQLNIDTDLI
jgi:hypothetical protein